MGMPKTAKQWKEMRDFFARDIAQTSLALSQVVKERNLRMMGSLDPKDPESMIHKMLVAHQIVTVCEMFLWSYFMPMFAKYWSLRLRFEEHSNLRKERKLTARLQHFRGSYSIFKVAHEGAMTMFDMRFDQYHTVASQLGIDKEEDEEETDTGITWAAANPEVIESKLKSHRIAKHNDIQKLFDSNKKSEFPSFETAVKLARELMDTLLEYRPKAPEIEDDEVIAEPPIETPKEKKEKSQPVEEEVLLPDDSINNSEPDT